MSSAQVRSEAASPQPVAPAAAAVMAERKPVGFTLRMKAILTFLVLMLYLTAIGLYLAHDREKLLHIVQQMEVLHAKQAELVKVNAVIAHIVVESQYLLNSSDFATMWEDLQLDVAGIHGGLIEIKKSHPEDIPNITRFERSAASLAGHKTKEKLRLLRDSTQELNAQFEKLETVIEEQIDSLTRQYAELNQNISWSALTMTFLGVFVFGAGATLFFSRLASDIQKLETRAVAIVSGFRGEDLKVSRNDELGSLIAAVNRMQSELRRFEQKQALSWQQRFHQERLAVVGALASAVAHEISNPISSISGISQVTIEAIRAHQRPDDKTLCDREELIVKQTERISLVVRQIANFSAPHSTESELFDANELVQTTCNFIRYDKRFKEVDLLMELAPADQMPALNAVADHLTQVLTNLLLNAADAINELTDRKPRICVSTRNDHNEFTLSVADNGHGMSADTLLQAFNESYTTKSASKGRGIGLYLCKMLIEGMGGRIELKSAPGVGTTAEVHLPFRRTPETQT